MTDQQVVIKEKQTRNLVFNGTGSGYFRVCIVNLLLIIITFGIFGAWALVPIGRTKVAWDANRKQVIKIQHRLHREE